MLKKFPALILLLFAFTSAMGQTANIRGLVTDEYGNPLPGIKVLLTGTLYNTETEPAGTFHMEGIPFGEYALEINSPDHAQFIRQIKIDQQLLDLGKLEMLSDAKAATILPTVSTEADENSDAETVSSALNASRDPFESAVAYTFSYARFRERGYTNEYNTTLMNGLPMMDMATGRTLFSTWGGLNDVIRNRDGVHGLGASDETFGSIGGVTSINSRASQQRKQMQVSYMISNRSYTNRLMATFGSGLMKGGWSVAASVSRRWADEAYVEGTFYDAYGYYFSIEKIIKEHAVSLTHFGSKAKYARTSPGTQEVFDLTGNHYYNSYWGYQNGEKRSSAVNDNFVPLTQLNHVWKINQDATLESVISYQAGKEKRSALEWFNAPDPRPDYYRNLPSFITLTDSTPQAMENAAAAAALFSGNTDVSQIDWERLYEANYISGDTAVYIIEDRISEHKRTGFSTKLDYVASDRSLVTIGAHYQRQVTDYYKEVNDLLGAQYYIDWNKYAEQDFPGNTTALQNDANNPDRLVKEGDRFGYDYTADISKYGVWMQWQHKRDYFDYFVSVFLDETRFNRTGNVRNGIFEKFSYGEDAGYLFTNQGIKGGVTYKMNNRNYIYANAAWMTKAPLFENAYVSPRTRNMIAPGLQNEILTSFEAGYLLRTPFIKGRITGYYTMANDKTETNSFYHDDFRTFVNYTVVDGDITHSGIEAAAEINMGHGLFITPVVAITQNTFNNRPLAYITQDNKDTVLAAGESLYIKNFNLGGGAQSAYTLGFTYRGRQFWNVYLNVSYYDNIWIAVNPARRTPDAVDLKDPGSSEWNAIIDQEKADGQFIVDLNATKSWKLNNKFKSLKHNTFILLSAGISNLLNNKDLITGGFEQLRFDFREKNPYKFAPKYFYGFGTTYNITATLRFN